MSEVIVITSGKEKKAVWEKQLPLPTLEPDWLMGKKTVVVDTDIGLRNLDVVLGLENRIVYNLVDVVHGSCRLKQALIRDKRHPELYLLPSAQTKDKTAVSPEQMIKLTDDLREEFDYILLDCPAGIEQGFKNAIAGADKALVVYHSQRFLPFVTRTGSSACWRPMTCGTFILLSTGFARI